MSKRVPQATQLIDLALKTGVELFHTPEGVAYTVIKSRGHRETWPIRSPAFKLWLASRYYARTKGSANAQATNDALAVLEAQARFEGATEPVFTRLAEHAGSLYLDLADDAWQAVKIGPTGWSVEAAPPVRFRRPRGMFPLPMPECGGPLDELREFLNVNDSDWILVAGWLVGALRPDHPFPILAIHGEPGSGKSTQGRMLRTLIDPNKGPLRSPPREEGDLILQAFNGWVVGYDNLSVLTDWLNDALCRISTGAAFGKRQLYADDEEVLFAVQRPIVYTAIAELAVKPDLSDRTIGLVLPQLTRRRDEKDDLWPAFHRAHPRILGALLDAASCALRNVATTTLLRTPRMADFARWVTAGETGLGWKSRTFLRAYEGSREAAHDAVLESSAVGQAVLHFMQGRSEWQGNAQSLLRELDAVVDDATRRDKKWPQGEGGPRALAGRLRTIAKDLRGVRLEVDFHKVLDGEKRVWVLCWPARNGGAPLGDAPATGTVPGESTGASNSWNGRDGRDGPPPLLSDEGPTARHHGPQHQGSGVGSCPERVHIRAFSDARSIREPGEEG